MYTGCCEDVLCLPCKALQVVIDALVVVLCCPCRSIQFFPLTIATAKLCAALVPWAYSSLRVETLTEPLVALKSHQQVKASEIVQVLLWVPFDCNRGAGPTCAVTMHE